jgi:hypothetical protein
MDIVAQILHSVAQDKYVTKTWIVIDFVPPMQGEDWISDRRFFYRRDLDRLPSIKGCLHAKAKSNL